MAFDDPAGGQAFPRPGDEESIATPGMSVRDYFAAAAMQGILANPSESRGSYSDVAEWAYLQADAMLAERGARDAV